MHLIRVMQYDFLSYSKTMGVDHRVEGLFSFEIIFGVGYRASQITTFRRLNVNILHLYRSMRLENDYYCRTNTKAMHGDSAEQAVERRITSAVVANRTTSYAWIRKHTSSATHYGHEGNATLEINPCDAWQLPRTRASRALRSGVVDDLSFGSLTFETPSRVRFVDNAIDTTRGVSSASFR